MYLCSDWSKGKYCSSNRWKIKTTRSYGIYYDRSGYCIWSSAITIYCTLCRLCNGWRMDGKRRRRINCLWWLIKTCRSLPYTVFTSSSSSWTWSVSWRCILLTFTFIRACCTFKWELWWWIFNSFTNYWNTGRRYLCLYSYKRNFNYGWTDFLENRYV